LVPASDSRVFEPEGLGPQAAAILVVYDAQSEPGPLIEQLQSLLACIVLVDNSPQGHPAAARVPQSTAVHHIHHRNVGGLAGAYNAALGWLEHHCPLATHVVFLDDDSDVSALTVFLNDLPVVRLLHEPTTAAVAPVYRDRATGLRASHMQLTRFGFHFLPRNQRGLVPVAFVINSMSVWRRTALRAIGPFNEALAVDRVDTEYCLRARDAGLSVYIDGDHEFAHSIGERRKYSWFGVTLQSGGHGPERRFMIARNTVWLARRYATTWPSLVLLSLLWIGYEAIGVLMSEPAKGRKLMALARGVSHGLLRRMPVPFDSRGA
jgi:rhamnosyltransferase